MKHPWPGRARLSSVKPGNTGCSERCGHQKRHVRRRSNEPFKVSVLKPLESLKRGSNRVASPEKAGAGPVP
jgi:hypothetical protein